jgi:hypothetical protein
VSQPPQHNAPEALIGTINSGSTTEVLDEHVDTGDALAALTEIQEAIDVTLGMLELIDTISVKLAPPAEAASVSLIFSIPELLQQSASSQALDPGSCRSAPGAGCSAADFRETRHSCGG